MILPDASSIVAALRLSSLALFPRSLISRTNTTALSNDYFDGPRTNSAQEPVAPQASPSFVFDGEQYRGSDIPFGEKPVLPGQESNTQTASAVPATSPAKASYKAKRALPLRARDDGSCNPEPYNSPGVLETELPSANGTRAAIFRYRQQSGVNLGSWFVLEKWMVPSLFCSGDGSNAEIELAAGWNGQAKALLEKHWDTFITESDFAWMSSVGINTVRLPLGYWHIGTGDRDWMTDTAFAFAKDTYDGAWSRVLRAISMADKYDIGVLVDLHGAPGSQNGMDHSGVSDGHTGLFESQDNQQKAISVLSFLTKTFVDTPNVVGVQLLNEPSNVPELWDFYGKALDALRTSTPGAENFPFYIHDAFDINQGASFVQTRGREWTILDHHSYYVFTESDQNKPATDHITDLGLSGSVGSQMMEAGMSINGNMITGEWSTDLTDQSLSGEQSPDDTRRQFGDVQLETYRSTCAGFTYWSFKKEFCDGDTSWCFQTAVGRSLPDNFFSYDGLSENRSLQPSSVPDPSSSSSLAPVASVTSSLSSASASSTPSARLGRRWNPREHRAVSIHDKRVTDRLRRDAPGATPSSSAPIATASGVTVLRNGTIWSASGNSTLTKAQEAIQLGYADGYTAAKMFAEQGPGMSRLGFKWQYVEDTLTAQGSKVARGKEGYYREWFEKGLTQGETMVAGVVAKMTKAS